MRRRLLYCTTAGFVIAVFWATYAALLPLPHPAAAPGLWLLIDLTFPIAGASMSLNFPLSIYFAFLGNVATYLAVGALVEAIRLLVHRIHESHDQRRGLAL